MEARGAARDGQGQADGKTSGPEADRAGKPPRAHVRRAWRRLVGARSGRLILHLFLLQSLGGDSGVACGQQQLNDEVRAYWFVPSPRGECPPHGNGGSLPGWGGALLYDSQAPLCFFFCGT